MRLAHPNLPVIEHAGFLEELNQTPPYLMPAPFYMSTGEDAYAWSFYSGGIHGQIHISETQTLSPAHALEPGWYRLKSYYFGQLVERPAQLKDNGRLDIRSSGPIAPSGGVLIAQLENDQISQTLILKEQGSHKTQDDDHLTQSFYIYKSATNSLHRTLKNIPTDKSMVRFRVSVGEEKPLHSFQLSPSVLDVTGRRVPIFYHEAQERLAELLLKHRVLGGTTSIYTFGDVDYFGQFAIQEVGRLLGVRNIWNQNTGYSEVTQAEADLMGHEGPFVGQEEALEHPEAFYLLSGWNGMITHLPLFDQLYQRDDLDIYLVEVMVTETAKAIAGKYGVDRVLLIKPGTDALLALAVGHQLLNHHSAQLPYHFIEALIDNQGFESYSALAKSEDYAPEKVAQQIAATPDYEARILKGIQAIANALTTGPKAAFHFQGKGPAQSAGKTAYSYWNNLWAITRKLGYDENQNPLGGLLTLPSYESEHTQAQHLAENHFFGRVPLDAEGCKEAALRMGLPPESYLALTEMQGQSLNAFLTSESEQPELLICIGQGLETQVLQSPFWQNKLQGNTTLVVIDPQPGPALLSTAALCLPSPPQVASTRLIQNADGELTLSMPRRKRPHECYSVATIIYDLMDHIAQYLTEFEEEQLEHPDLALLLESGYLNARFSSHELGGQLDRVEGEVSRSLLWDRIQAYLTGVAHTKGPLYCRPETPDGELCQWDMLLKDGTFTYRYHPSVVATSFARDIYRTPQKLRLAYEAPQTPEAALRLLNGASMLSDRKPVMRYAIRSYHKNYLHHDLDTARYPVLYISEELAQTQGFVEDQQVALMGDEPLGIQYFIVRPTSRLKGQCMYLASHYTQSGLTGQYYQAPSGQPFALTLSPIQEETHDS